MIQPVIKHLKTGGPRRYAEDLGWRIRFTPEGTVYTGLFRAGGLTFHGWIRQDPTGQLHFLIHRPPMQMLRETDYFGCFHQRNDGWQLVAFKPYAQPPNVDSGIGAIQRALIRTLQERASRRGGPR